MQRIGILVVCRANVCRSPMAQALLEQRASEAGIARSLRIRSAGTHAGRGGQKPDPRVLRTLAAHGVSVGRIRSRQVETKDFAAHDYLLALDDAIERHLAERSPAELQQRIHPLLRFAPELVETEVPDPYFGNQAGFERVFGLLDAGVSGFLAYIRRTHGI